MRYPILLQQRADGKHQAAVPLLSSITVVSNTRSEALAAVQLAISDALQTNEVIYVDVGDKQPRPSNPWVDTAGLFTNDPDFEAILHDIYAARGCE